MNYKKLGDAVKKAVRQASFCLRDDVKQALVRALRREKNRKAKQALRWILDNAEIAQKESLAICQDTGLPLAFMELGKEVRVDFKLVRTVERAMAQAYRENYLRPSLVDPLQRGKPSYQGGICHLDFNPRVKGVNLTVFPKGFGCENKSQLKMFNPTAGLAEIEHFVVEAANQAGPEACPPFVVGVGIGGTADSALLLAKKALLGSIDQPNPDKLLNSLEKRLLKKINALKIGPMGLGGKTTALAVKVKKAPTHIAGLPVGVNISCHALRSYSVKL